MSDFLDAASLLSRPINDIWDATIGAHITYWANKKRFDMERKLEDYKAKIMAECAKIAPNKVLDPKLSIVGPALEASRFYIEEDILRDMFAKLIANSMNADKAKFTNGAFVEIIKQMCPLDAIILKTFLTTTEQPACRVIERADNNPLGTYKILIDLLYIMPNQSIYDADSQVQNTISLNNLSRLGLLEYDVGAVCPSLKPDSLYKPYEEFMSNLVKKEHPNSDFKRGAVKITALGQAFISACL